MRRHLKLMLAAIIVLLYMIDVRILLVTHAQPAISTQKKFIHVGWDTPTAEYFQTHSSSLQDRPFDGLAFKLNTDVTLAFENRRWSEREMHFDLLPQIEWGRYSDNFILVWGQSDTAVNWFDDALWQIVQENTRLLSRAVSLSKAKGIIFDPEFYFSSTHASLWSYNSTLYPELTFAQVEAKVRQRGLEYITALQSEKPAIHFFSLWAIAIAYTQTGGTPATLPDTQFALLPAFINGVLDGLNESSVLTDGNEFSYPYDDTVQFAESYELIRRTAAALVPIGERPRYETRVRIGASLYADHILDLDGEQTVIASTEERLRWLQHNVYYALLTADEYAWMWNERLNWWGYDLQNETSTPAYSNISPAVIENINTARTLFAAGQKLGFDMQRGPDATFVFLSEPQVEQATKSGASTFVAGEPIEMVFKLSKDAYVFRIQLLANSLTVGETNGRTLTVTNLAPGTYTFVARAFLTNGQHVTSNLLTVIVSG